MGKTGKIILIVILALVAVVVIGGIIIYNQLMSDDIDTAFLTVESGTVQVDSGSGYRTVQGEVMLSLNDKIKTIDGTAVVTLYESILIELEPNTEISLKSLKKDDVGIKQESGSTWNKFTSITGIQSYEVETPTTVATVRGTEFGVDTSGEGDSIFVGEGNVGVESEGEFIDLAQFQKTVKKQGIKLAMQRLTAKDKQRILVKVKKNVQRLESLRERVIEKQGPIIKKAMAKYGVSEAELRGYLAKIDSGEIDDGELIEKSPVKLPVMYRFKKMNDELKNQKRLIQIIESFQPTS